MGLKRGRGAGSFVNETRGQVFDFYRDILQDMKAWQPKAPRLPEVPESVSDIPDPEPPPFAAAQVREVGEASDPAARNHPSWSWSSP
jgi:hypothetical protein